MRWLPSCLVAVFLCVLSAVPAGAARSGGAAAAPAFRVKRAPAPPAPAPGPGAGPRGNAARDGGGLPPLPGAAAPDPAAGCDSLQCLAPPAPQGSLTYRARVVHNNRSALSYVSGRVDFASGDFAETVDQSYLLDWQQMPARMTPSRCALPSIWGVGGRTAQQLGDAMPRFDSPLLRHFITGQLLAAPQAIVPNAQFLAGQLKIGTVQPTPDGFEIVASFRGAPLVLVGRTAPGAQSGGRPALHDLAVLGPSSELYQYFFEDVAYAAAPLAPLPALPVLDTQKYVSFPAGGPKAVAIRPVKDWLVFQASLPSGRPLNLVFDSGAEQMVIDDMVLKLDSRLSPVGDMAVSGALSDAPMQLYEGFSFDVGGVQFKNLSVAGTSLTQLGFGADVRIHGVVGNEILQLCKLDLDLENGLLTLLPPGSAGPAAGAGAQELPLTFIRELPHVEAAVHSDKPALLLLDTGQRSPLSVNMDYLEHYKLSDSMKMNGFLGDITGGLLPRYIVENLPVSLAGETYTEKVADASADSTFDYGGVPVIGSIGFPLLAHHFGGITFDYSRKLLTLRDPGQDRVFAGRPEAWTAPAAQVTAELPPAGAQPPAPRAHDLDSQAAQLQASRTQRPAAAPHPAAAPLGLDPGGYGSYGGWDGDSALAQNPNTPERAEFMRSQAEARKAARQDGAGLAQQLLTYSEQLGAQLPAVLHEATAPEAGAAARQAPDNGGGGSPPAPPDGAAAPGDTSPVRRRPADDASRSK